MTLVAPNNTSAHFDKLAIQELAQTERAARDLWQWDVMRECYHADSRATVSWFDGTGHDFVAASQVMSEGGNASIHEVYNTLVNLNGERAIADTGCAIHVRGRMDGVEADIVSYCRHRSRVEKVEGKWRLRTFYATYQRDVMAPTNPSERLVIDAEQLATFRPSYKFLSYFLVRMGENPIHDLPGFDRPDLVAHRVNADQEWLNAPDV